jgi:hypothetical protein
MNFRYTHETTRNVTFSADVLTDYYNLKNKSVGARRYGYRLSVVRFANPDGETMYRSDFQTLLDGQRYQSSKHGAFVATEAEARAALEKTVVSATKRYAKLAQDAASKVEHRP